MDLPIGYTYSRLTESTSEMATVHLIASGFHAGDASLEDTAVTIPLVTLRAQRLVNEEEALSGIGTLLSSLTAAVVDSHWRYGTVVDYDFANASLILEDEGCRFSIPWSSAADFIVMPEAIFALAPYNHCSVTDVSSSALDAETSRILKLMNGSPGCPGKRKAAALAGTSACRGGDDIIQIFTVSDLATPHLISVQHAIDWTFYDKAGRKAPSYLTHLEKDPRVQDGKLVTAPACFRTCGGHTIQRSPRVFRQRSTQAAPPDTLGMADVIRQLQSTTPPATHLDHDSDSDADSFCPSTAASVPVAPAHRRAPSPSPPTSAHAPPPAADPLDVLRRQLADQQLQLANTMAQLNAYRTNPAAAPILSAIKAPSKLDKSSFRPSDQQTRVHRAVTADNVLGTYVGVTAANSFCEDLIAADYFNMDPHPQLAIRIYDFGFGPGKLSILHGRKFSVCDAYRLYNSQHVSMTDFSNSGKVPRAKSIGPSEDGAHVLLQCIHNWHSLTQHIWCASMVHVFQRLAMVVEAFSSSLSSGMVFPSALVVEWIDVKLYQLRSALASSDDARITAALDNISINHQSFRMVEAASYASRLAPARADPAKSTRVGATPPVRGVPRHVCDLIPTAEDGRKACLRFWSQAGCSGRGRTCDNPRLAHFQPPRASVPDIVLDYITTQYGALRDSAFVA
jgi:hypothetical protein